MEEGAKHLEFLMETAQIWQEEKKEQHRRAHKAQADAQSNKLPPTQGRAQNQTAACDL